MRRLTFSWPAVLLPVALAAGTANLRTTFLRGADDEAQAVKPASTPSSVELDALDRRAEPCTDFYQFACGGWVAKNPVPSDRRSWGRFVELENRNFELLRHVLEAPAAATDDAGGSTRKAADYYAACMDDSAIEAKGLTPLTSELALIGALLNPDDLPVMVAHLHEVGVNALFRFGAQTDLSDATQSIANADQDGLGLPDRDYYIKIDDRSDDIRAKYAAHIERMLTLAGDQPADAAARARAVIAVETALAEASMDRVKRRDLAALQHRMTRAELQALTPAFDWKKYLGAADAPPVQTLNVTSLDYFRAVNRIITSTPTGDLTSYLRWHLLHASAELLPKAFADADFDFFSRTFAGQREQTPRWRRCVSATDRHLGEALGKAFVEATFSPRAKTDTLTMVGDIKGAMRQDIDSAPWMSGETKKAAMTKLEAVVDRIGYPDTWRDYSDLSVQRGDALGNLERARAFERHRTLRQIGEPVDRGEWSMTPPTVNAYYSPDRNNINFPAGILQPPF